MKSITNMISEKRVIDIRLPKTTCSKDGGKFRKLTLGCLPKAIQRFLEVTNKVRRLGVDSRRQMHIYFFRKIAIEKCIVNILLMNRSVVGSSNGQKITNSNHFFHWAKVSVKSMPFCCVLMSITSRALNV